MTISISRGASVTLAWSPPIPNLTIAGYRLYYGTSSHNYSTMLDLGNVTSGTITGLTAGQTWYFAVTAYNVVGLESPFSGELSYTLPPASLLATLKLRMATNPKRAILSGTAPAGYVYDVLAATDLKTWNKIGSVTTTGSGTLGFTNASTTNKTYFYRLRQTSPAATNFFPTLKLRINRNPMQAVLSSTAPANYVYDVQAATDLKTWITVGNVTATASGNLQFTNAYTTNTTYFYRLKQTSP
jgi:hypothetical protein